MKLIKKLIDQTREKNKQKKVHINSPEERRIVKRLEDLMEENGIVKLDSPNQIGGCYPSTMPVSQRDKMFKIKEPKTGVLAYPGNLEKISAHSGPTTFITVKAGQEGNPQIVAHELQHAIGRRIDNRIFPALEEIRADLGSIGLLKKAGAKGEILKRNRKYALTSAKLSALKILDDPGTWLITKPARRLAKIKLKRLFK